MSQAIESYWDRYRTETYKLLSLLVQSSQLPASLTPSGNLRVALSEDAINLINTLNTLAKSNQLPSSLTTAGNFKVALSEDAINLINTLNTLAKSSQLPSSLTTSGNLKVALSEDAINLISTLNTLAKSNQLPSSLTTAGNLKVALSEDAINLINTLNTLAKASQLPTSLTANGNFKIALAEDLINLISTLNTLINTTNTIAKSFNAYNVLTIDLGTARTGQLIASNVIYLKILSATSGATYSIKLFSTANDLLDQSILPVGAEITGIDNANVYLTNTAQTGATLKILVFRRV